MLLLLYICILHFITTNLSDAYNHDESVKYTHVYRDACTKTRFSSARSTQHQKRVRNGDSAQMSAHHAGIHMAQRDMMVTAQMSALEPYSFFYVSVLECVKTVGIDRYQ